MNRWTKLSIVLTAWILIASFGLAACGGSSGSTSGQATDVQVTLTDFKIDSSLTTFKVGVPYHFIVKNNGAVAHELDIIPPSTEQLTPDQVTQMSLAKIGGDQLPAGGSATLDYTFTQAYPSGALEFACHLPGHYDAGMHTAIVVNQ
ncbi:MAG: hypothetical protein H6Q37_2588 [Chloroflexi bacterium]|jgi:uncharacterized cupredoxin-like copper-binding protein|nr:hypothetical protein [Chloroflexota bacterium]